MQQDYRATLEDQAPKPAAAAGVPVVAVVMPTYNRWPHLRAAVDSVLDQEFPGVECIVVDDGSADGTPEKLVAAYGDRIRVLRMPANGGPAAAIIIIPGNNSRTINRKICVSISLNASSANICSCWNNWKIDKTVSN